MSHHALEGGVKKRQQGVPDICPIALSMGHAPRETMPHENDASHNKCANGLVTGVARTTRQLVNTLVFANRQALIAPTPGGMSTPAGYCAGCGAPRP